MELSKTALSTAEAPAEASAASDFIRQIIAADIAANKYLGRTATRFPPEPNGYLHIGHAKSICLNFGAAADVGGVCHMRFDDTNPETEDMEYVEAIQRDVKWLGFDWGEHLYFASDYYEVFYQCARKLIIEGKAYVDSLNEKEMSEYRGTVTQAGRPSPYRSRSVEENLDLFERMAEGEFPNGAHVLRAKGDMAAANMKMRDPLLYRIRHSAHYRTGDIWCIYPMYDYAHPLSDCIEGITHSICTLEFENNRDIYNWVVENAWDVRFAMKPEFQKLPVPRQYEFARLNLDYTIMSKRKLLELVQNKLVKGWDDPRMPTIAGLRRRGIPAAAIRDFAQRVGIAKTNSRVELGLFESCLRNDLNLRAPRVMAVLRPLKVRITNYPAGQVEWLDASYWPYDVPKEGSRQIPFSSELYIEQDDFMENPPKKFYRLSPGREVRLRYGYIVRCVDVVKDEHGKVVEVLCTYDPDTRSGSVSSGGSGDGGSGRKVEGTIHWLSATHALPAEVRLYDRLITVANPDDEAGDEGDWKSFLNSNSLEVLPNAWVEPSLANDPPDTRYQFERQGYFWPDPLDSKPGKLVFNRIVTLRDSWAKEVESQKSEDFGALSRAVKSQKSTAQQTSSADGEIQNPKLVLSKANVSKIQNQTNEPTVRERLAGRSSDLVGKWEVYTSRYGLSHEDAEVLTRDASTVRLMDEALVAHSNAKGIASLILGEVLRDLKSKLLAAGQTGLPFGGQQLGKLVKLVDEGVITNAIAKTVYAELSQSGGDPAQIVEAKGLRPLADVGALEAMVDKVIAANGDKAAQLRGGKTGLIGFFVGQVMKESGGKANAQQVQELLQKKLASA